MSDGTRTHDTPYPPQEARVAGRVRWDAFARRLRTHLRFALGLMPELPPAPLRVQRVEPYRGDGFGIERFALETLLDALGAGKTTPLDLPCYERIGGWATLQRLIPRAE